MQGNHILGCQRWELLAQQFQWIALQWLQFPVPAVQQRPEKVNLYAGAKWLEWQITIRLFDPKAGTAWIPAFLFPFVEIYNTGIVQTTRDAIELFRVPPTPRVQQVCY